MSRRPLAHVALALLLAPIAGCASRAAAQPAETRVAAPVPPAPPLSPTIARTLRVRADGRVSVKPDVALVQAGVQVTAKDPQKASADASARMKALLAELARLGIPEKDIQTSEFRLTAERPWDNGRQLPVQGYTSATSVRIKVRKLEQLPVLLGRLTAVGVNAVDSVQFEKDELGPVRDEALALARRRRPHARRRRGEGVGRDAR